MSGENLRMPADPGARTAAASEDLHDLLAEQAALRRVATLVAEGAEPEAVLDAIATETSRVIGVGAISLIRYDAQARTMTRIAVTYGARAAMPAGVSYPFDESPLGSLVVGSGRPTRIDDWAPITGTIAARHRAAGFGQSIGAPIVIGGDTWGYLGAYAEEGEVLPTGCEARLAKFTQLMATAIANVEARDELRGLAESQGALRRVATLVAQGAEPRAVFTAVAKEAARMLGVGAVSLISWDEETQLLTKIYGTHGERSAVPDGGQWTLAEGPEAAMVVQTGGPVRIDDWSTIPGQVAARHREQGFGQCVAAPIVVGGALWGLISAFGEADEVLPAGSEGRLADFTQLMASAISNAQARAELRGLAEQQGAALRRVATLVGQQAPSAKIFNAVAGEASRALGVGRVDVGRCREDGSVALIGSTRGVSPACAFSVSGSHVAAKVMETGRAARIDASPEGFRSVVGAPITVDGALWGVIVVLADQPLRDDTETRLSDFTHLVASSISNVHARNNLIASRARIVTASDETRRRIERNLHDGIQQRVVALALSLRAVRSKCRLSPEVQAALEDVAEDLDELLEEIRVFSQGLHPALLSRAGLGPSLRELARRSPIPVSLDFAAVGRFPEPIETAVYYVVSEAMANAAKHSGASEVNVNVASGARKISVAVADDGIGGAVLGRGSGLIGLVDRVEALGGRFTLDSVPGDGTAISVSLPLSTPGTDVPSAL